MVITLGCFRVWDENIVLLTRKALNSLLLQILYSNKKLNMRILHYNEYKNDVKSRSGDPKGTLSKRKV